MTNFRKNIISFPQELNELKHMAALISSLEVGDLINVRLDASTATPELPQRAQIRAIRASGFLVELANGEQHTVSTSQVAERLKLPWTPASLRDYLIILRRRNASRDDYVEDLRARRNIIRRILQLLTKQGQWRDDQGTEPLHQYYVGFDFMTDDEYLEHIR